MTCFKIIFQKQAVTAWHNVLLNFFVPLFALCMYGFSDESISFLPEVYRALASAQMCWEQRACFLKNVNDVTQDFDSLTAEDIQYFQNICKVVSKHCHYCCSQICIYATILLSLVCAWHKYINFPAHIYTSSLHLIYQNHFTSSVLIRNNCNNGRDLNVHIMCPCLRKLM